MQLGELVRADNIDIDDRNKIRMRRGYVQDHPGSAISAAWASNDESRMFIIDSGDLQEYTAPGSVLTLQSGLPADEAYFEDAGDRYFLSVGDVLGLITSDGYTNLVIDTPGTPLVRAGSGNLPAGLYLISAVLIAPDGRQGGACPVNQVALDADSALEIEVDQVAGFETRVYVSGTNGDQLQFVQQLDGGMVVVTDTYQMQGDILDDIQIKGGPPPVSGGPIAYHNGQLHISLIDRQAGLTYIYRSEPFWPHLFLPWQDAETVHGVVVMMASTSEGLIVGTDRSIFLITDGGLTTLAEYGAVPGQNRYIDPDNSKVYFWTAEGICRALPFENLSKERLSAPPGHRCFVGRVDEGGFERLVVGTYVADGTYDQDTADNPRERERNRYGQ
jgi:hypothetical protein